MSVSVHHWRDVEFPFNAQPPIDARMLREGGYLTKQSARVKRMIQYANKSRKLIKFDKEYVLTSICTTISPLATAGLSKQDILRLVSEALDYLPPQD